MDNLMYSGVDKVDMVMMELVIQELKTALPGTAESMGIFKLLVSYRMLTYDLETAHKLAKMGPIL